MNLIQLAQAAEKLAQERPPIVVESARCYHAKDKNSACDLCVTTCPTEAISLEEGVHVLGDQCIRCGLCLHSCPAGVFDGHDQSYELFNYVNQLVDRQQVEIACKHHPDPAKGARGVDAVVQTSACLSALGTSTYVGLMSLGVEALRVRLDACADCPLRVVEPQIEKTIDAANKLLSDAGYAGGIKAEKTHSRWWQGNRSVHSVKNPPLSRRGFFRMVTLQAEERVEELAPRHEPQILSDNKLPRERRRLIRALSKLDAVQLDAPVSDATFGKIKATNACTACGVCSRICPTDAIRFTMDGDHFDLTFETGNCTRCGLCMAYCDADALQWDGQPSFAELISGTEIRLITGDLQRCEKCGVPFAGHSEDKLCSVCAARRDNPFGNNLPPGVLKRLPENVRKKLLSSST